MNKFPSIPERLREMIAERFPTASKEDKDFILSRLCGGRPDDPRPFPEGSAAIPLDKAKAILEKDEFNDFVYDRRSKTVFYNVKSYTSHEIFLSGLLRFYRTDPGSGWAEFDEALDIQAYYLSADEYIMSQLGWFFSGAYGNSHVTISEATRMTPQEKTVFSSFRFIRIDR